MPLSLPSVPVMSEDSNSSSFDLPVAGIEATDLSSLLSQFEEASQSLDGTTTPPDKETNNEAPSLPVIKSKPDQFMAQQTKGTAITPPATPPPEVLARIRAKRKRKLAIMLPTLLPTKIKGQITPSKSASGVAPTELNNNKPNSVPVVANNTSLSDGNVNINYYDHIPDHDYCVNSPKMSPKRDKTEFPVDSVLSKSVPQPLPQEEEIVISAGDTSVLDSDVKPDEKVVEADADLEEGEVPESPVHPVSSTKISSSKGKQEASVSKPKDRGKRNYRRRDSSPFEDDGRYFDKIPAYFTTLSKPVKPPKKDKLSEHQSGIRKEDFIERDSSPSRHDPSVYDKLPAYYSCFTNSTRYDSNQNDEQYDLEDLDEYPRAKRSRRYSASRSRSRSSSRSRSRSYSRSRSRHRSLRRRRSYSSASGSSCSSRSSSRSRSRSYSKSKSRSRSRSYSHSRSYRSYSRSRSRGRSRSRYHGRRRNWSRSFSRSWSRSRSRSYSRGRSCSVERRRQERKEFREKEKARQIEERRIVYVGKIPDGYTRRELRRRFDRFGDIEEVSVHFREYGDNYGFVTYAYTCDAYAAIEKGNDIPGEKRFDLCFGGRRQFCDTVYADLDGKAEVDEELAPLPDSGSLDFDQLLKQAKQLQKKKR